MAPVRLTFVCTASGEDPDYPASELEHHGPQTRGWQAPRYCKYPQEILLQLEGPSRITKLQLLSHEFKIATKMELYVDVPPAGGPEQGPQHAQRPGGVRRLGYLSFDSNERSRFQARELKSVDLDVTASVVRLVVHACHPNGMNVYAQVGIVAVNVVGEPLYPGGGGRAFVPLAGGVGGPQRPKLAGGVPAGGWFGAISPAGMPGGGFGPYRGPDVAGVDAVTAGQIAELSLLKAQAIGAEDYDEAKRIKGAIERLQGLGRRIADLEAQKAAAISAEDYDLAKALKAQIDALHKAGPGGAGLEPHRKGKPGPDEIFSRVLGKKAGAGPGPSMGPEGEGEPGGGGGAYGEYAAEGGPGPEDQHHHSPGYDGGGGGGGGGGGRMAMRSSFERVAKREPPVSMLAYDERPAAAAGKPWADELEEGAGGGGPDGGGGTEPEELSAVALKDAGLMISIFGDHETRCLYSKSWALREGALQKVLASVAGGGPPLEADEATVFDALVRLIIHALRDQVPTVFQCGLQLLKAALAGPGRNLGPKAANARISEVLPVLLDRTADVNARTRDAAVDAVLALSEDEAAGLSMQVIAAPLLRPVKSPGAWKPALGRLQLVAELLARHKLDPPAVGGLPVEPTMRFVAAALASPNAQARATAIKIAVEAHQLAGSKVDRYFKDISPAVREVLEAALGGEPLAPAAPPLSQPAKAPRAAPPPKPTSAKPNRVGSAKPVKPAPAAPPRGGGGGGGGGAAQSPAMKTLHEHTHGAKPNETAAGGGGDLASFQAKLAAREAAVGPDHPDVAAALCDLAVAHNDAGAAEAARPLYERALQILEAHNGPEGSIAQVLTDLAVLHIEAERTELGRPMLERALGLQERVLGADHEDVAAIRDVLQSLDAGQ